MKTLRITLPIGRTFLQAALVLLVFCAALELFARTPVAKFLFPRVSYGSSHPHFEVQLTRLKERYTKEGEIDCIFIGNSQVLYGIDPSMVEQAYQEKTGRTIRCQNFGLGGLTPLTAGPLARMLIRNFHPSLIVFETGVLDYSTSSMEGTDESIMSSPWMKYQLGHVSLDGWLYENSYAFRMVAGIDRTLKYIEESNTHIEWDGHAKLSGQTTTSIEDQIQFFETALSTLEITDRQVGGLENLLSLNPAEVQVIIVETPIHPTFYQIKRKVRNLYPTFENMLTFQTHQADADLWLTRNEIDLPAEEWHDLAHLNEEGSIRFSLQIGYFLSRVYTPPSPNEP